MSDGIPGVPGERSIGGQPLSEAASDDGGGGGGGGSDGGGGGSNEDDEPDIAPNVSGEAVRRSIEEGISVEEAQRQINEEQQQETESDSDGSGTSGGSANLGIGAGAAGPGTGAGPAGVPEDPTETGDGDTATGVEAPEPSAGTEDDPTDNGQETPPDTAEELLNQEGSRTDVPEWVRPDDDPQGSIDTSAAPQTAGDQFRYQEFRDREMAPPGTIARGITGDELRASLRFQEELQSNTNREGSDQADARVDPDDFRPAEDTTQQERDLAQEFASDREGIDPSEVETSIRQTEEGPRLVAEPTQEAIEDFQRAQAMDQLDQELEDEFGTSLQPGEDYTVERTGGDEFETQLTAEFRNSETFREFQREQAAEQIEPQLEQQVFDRREAFQTGVPNFPDLERGEDYTIERTDDGQYRATLADDFGIGGRETNTDLDLPATDDLQLSPAQSDEIQATAPSGTGPVEQLRDERAEATEEEEQFGDIGAIPEDVPVVGGVEPDDALRDVGTMFNQYVSRPTGVFVGDVVEESIQGAGDAAAFVLPGENEDIQEVTETAGETAGRDIAQPAATMGTEILNVPQTTAGLIEAGELIGKGAETTALGDAIEGTDLVEGPADQGEDFDEFADRTGEAAMAAGADFAEQAQEEPLKTASGLTGSLLVSAGLIGAASRVSSTAGRASAYAVQPTEELASAGATRVLNRVPGGGRVLNRLPGGRVDPDEYLFVAGRKARAAPSTVRRSLERGRRLATGDFRLQGSARQQELAARFSPRAGTGEFGAETEASTTSELTEGRSQARGTEADRSPLMTETRSEPLGSDTESILDATTTETREGIQGPNDDPVSPFDQFLADERAQSGLVPEQRQRPDTDPATEPDIDPSRRRDDLLEGSPRDRMSSDITRRQQEMRRQAEGTFEGEQDPLAQAESRRESAMEPEARIDSEAEDGVGFRRAQASLLETAQEPAARLDDDLDVGDDTDIFAEQGVDQFTGPVAETGLETMTEQVSETETETETETAFEAIFETETEVETETETEIEVETETEVEFPIETETETKREPFLEEDDEDDDEFFAGGDAGEEQFEADIATPGELGGGEEGGEFFQEGSDGGDPLF